MTEALGMATTPYPTAAPTASVSGVKKLKKNESKDINLSYKYVKLIIDVFGCVVN